jgi:hypothetical protein
MLLGYSEKRQETMMMQLLAMGTVGLTIGAFGLAAWNLLF